MKKLLFLIKVDFIDKLTVGFCNMQSFYYNPYPPPPPQKKELSLPLLLTNDFDCDGCFIHILWYMISYNLKVNYRQVCMLHVVRKTFCTKWNACIYEPCSHRFTQRINNTRFVHIDVLFPLNCQTSRCSSVSDTL